MMSWCLVYFGPIFCLVSLVLPDGFLLQHASHEGLGPLIQFGLGLGFSQTQFSFFGFGLVFVCWAGFFGFCNKCRAFLVLFQSLGFGWVPNLLICGWLGTFCGWDLGFGSVWFILSIFG